jgi:hypothetical protein
MPAHIQSGCFHAFLLSLKPADLAAFTWTECWGPFGLAGLHSLADPLQHDDWVAFVGTVDMSRQCSVRRKTLSVRFHSALRRNDLGSSPSQVPLLRDSQEIVDVP